jgi:hypothetical protein
MKLTAIIKNFQNTIVGYFNNGIKEEDKYEVIERMTSATRFSILTKQEYKDYKYDSNIISHDEAYTYINFTTTLNNRTFEISENIKKQFKFVITGQGRIYIISSSNGSQTQLTFDKSYTYTPVDWDDSEIHSAPIYLKIGELMPYGGNASSKIDVYNRFGRNDGVPEQLV